MENRQNNMHFPNAKLYQSGGESIDNQIDKMREALLKKDGIVDEQNKNNFRFFISNCMNEKIIAANEETNSFTRQNFRADSLNRSRSSIVNNNPPLN